MGRVRLGADPKGIGLVGLRGRLPTIDGTLTVDSPPGVGTVVTAGSRCWPVAGLTASRRG
jgi:signal transduction histidine kinase